MHNQTLISEINITTPGGIHTCSSSYAPLSKIRRRSLRWWWQRCSETAASAASDASPLNTRPQSAPNRLSAFCAQAEKAERPNNKQAPGSAHWRAKDHQRPHNDAFHSAQSQSLHDSPRRLGQTVRERRVDLWLLSEPFWPQQESSDLEVQQRSPALPYKPSDSV